MSKKTKRLPRGRGEVMAYFKLFGVLVKDGIPPGPLSRKIITMIKRNKSIFRSLTR